MSTPDTDTVQSINNTIATDWRTRAVSTLSWNKCDNQAGARQGEAGGYFVEADGFPRRAYLKPAKPHKDSIARAAREKIAADLAHDLDLPVPPAQLTTLDEPLPEGCEAAVVVTLVMYPRQHPWEIVKKLPKDDSPASLAIAKMVSGYSHMLAFDTWVAQSDHGDHPHNIVWGYDPNDLASSELIFLDYAYSMGFNGNWLDDKWRDLQIAPFPPMIRENLNKSALRQTVERICDLKQEVIEAIVRRLPETHLQGDDMDLLSEALIGRRELLSNKINECISGA